MEEDEGYIFSITNDELNEFFKGRRLISFEEYYAFLEWKKEIKKRGA